MWFEVQVLVALVVTCCVSFVGFFKYSFSYWSNRNVATPSTPPTIPFGSLQGLKKSVHTSVFLQRLYNEMRGSGPFCGIYFFHKPAVLAISTDFIKRVLVTDFNLFQERGVYYNQKDDPLSAHLFSLDGPRWKPLRAKLTPTFSSGKMKSMFSTIVKVAQEMHDCVREKIATGVDVFEMKDLLSCFSSDVIGTCAFGLECNRLRNPDNQFSAMGNKAVGKQRNSGIKQFFLIAFADFARKLRMKSNHDDVAEYFLRIVRETVEYREANNIKRNDFMDLLIEIKNRGTVDGTSVGTLSMEEIAAQSFVFFIVGFGTSSTALSFALYELALNHDIQSKARREIDRVLQKNDGELTYETLMELDYIDQIINETLRKYPVSTIARKATDKYVDPECNITIEKGTLVMIPVYAIHHDSAYYPNPEQFDPLRFTPEVAATRPKSSFIPFGEGARTCIAVRFAMMKMRIALVKLLTNFEFSACERTPIPMEFAVMPTGLVSKTGIHLKLKAITSGH